MDAIGGEGGGGARIASARARSCGPRAEKAGAPELLAQLAYPSHYSESLARWLLARAVSMPRRGVGARAGSCDAALS
jgi:hypothetical protein